MYSAEATIQSMTFKSEHPINEVAEDGTVSVFSLYPAQQADASDETTQHDEKDSNNCYGDNHYDITTGLSRKNSHSSSVTGREVDLGK